MSDETPPDDPCFRWHEILERFEGTVAQYSAWQMWTVDLIRGLMTCSGIEKLSPGSSLNCFTIRPWTSRTLDEPTLVVTIDKVGIFNLTLYLEPGGEEALVFTRRSVATALEGVRWVVRGMGIELGRPRRELPPAEATQRIWLVFERKDWPQPARMPWDRDESEESE